MKQYRFIISGGGTGGHIYPAIAIANELKVRFPQAHFLFVGAKDRMEMEKVPKAGYAIEGLWISGLQRNLSRKNLLFPFKLIDSLYSSRKILRNFQPDVVIGTGGYASAPILRVASGMDIPCLIQEQNSFAGMTNRWLAKRVNTICVAYPDMEKFFPKGKIVLTGNPVRQDIVDIDQKRSQAQDLFKLNKEKKTLLVLGGSLGSKTINQLVAGSLNYFKEKNVQVIWQTGSFYYNAYKQLDEMDDVQVKDFIYDMDMAYAAADIIISRAGALSVSELCLVGKPVIFIPSPNVSENHQKKNALAVAEKNAAVLLEEKELDSHFEEVFSNLIASEEKQRELSANIKKLAMPNASVDIANEIEKLLIK